MQLVEQHNSLRTYEAEVGFLGVVVYSVTRYVLLCFSSRAGGHGTCRRNRRTGAEVPHSEAQHSPTITNELSPICSEHLHAHPKPQRKPLLLDIAAYHGSKHFRCKGGYGEMIYAYLCTRTFWSGCGRVPLHIRDSATACKVQILSSSFQSHRDTRSLQRQG